MIAKDLFFICLFVATPPHRRPVGHPQQRVPALEPVSLRTGRLMPRRLTGEEIRTTAGNGSLAGDDSRRRVGDIGQDG